MKIFITVVAILEAIAIAAFVTLKLRFLGGAEMVIIFWLGYFVGKFVQWVCTDNPIIYNIKFEKKEGRSKEYFWEKRKK